MTTAAIVLAAGGGTRFQGETHKLLAPFRGRPLIAWAVDSARAARLDGLAVVVGAVSVSEVVGAVPHWIRNPAWAEGQASSLQAAVHWADGQGHDAIVVGLGDQPLIPPEAWVAVAASSSPIAVATYGGRRRNPVRLGREVWALLPTTGDVGARSVVAEHPELVAEVACGGDPVDVDTVEDLASWT